MKLNSLDHYSNLEKIEDCLNKLEKMELEIYVLIQILNSTIPEVYKVQKTGRK